MEDLLYGEYTFQLSEPNSNCSEAKIFTGAGSSYSDIHDREVLDSVSDRPEREGSNANRRLLSNSPDPIVPILGTSSAKVAEWGSRQCLKRTM